MSSLESLIVGETLTRAAVTVSLPGQGSAAKTFKAVTLTALHAIAAELTPDGANLPAVDGLGSAAAKRAARLAYIADLLLPRLLGVPAQDDAAQLGSQADTVAEALDAHNIGDWVQDLSIDVTLSPLVCSKKLSELGESPLQAIADAMKAFPAHAGAPAAEADRPDLTGLNTATKKARLMDFIAPRLLTRIIANSSSDSSPRIRGAGRGGGSGGGNVTNSGAGAPRTAALGAAAVAASGGANGVASGSAGIGSKTDAELVEGFAPRGNLDADQYAEQCHEMLKELRVHCVTKGAARAKLAAYLRRGNNYVAHTSADAAWTTIARRSASIIDVTSNAAPTDYSKAVKNLPAALKEVAKVAHGYLDDNPVEEAGLEAATVKDVELKMQSTAPSIRALIMSDTSTQDKIEGKLGRVVRHLFKILSDKIESQLFPSTARSVSTSSAAASSFRRAAEDIVHGNLDFSALKQAYMLMGDVNDRIGLLIKDTPLTETNSRLFPRNVAWWPDFKAFLNIFVPTLIPENVGNLIDIAQSLTLHAVPTELVHPFIDQMVYELQVAIEAAKHGRGKGRRVSAVRGDFAGNIFTEQLQAAYDDLKQLGTIERSVSRGVGAAVARAMATAGLSTPTQSHGNGGGGGGGGGASGGGSGDGSGGGSDGGADGGGRGTKRTDLGAVSDLSSTFTLTSPELSYEGIIQHHDNKIGAGVLLRAMSDARVTIPEKGCVNLHFFGGCTTDGCSYSHSGEACSSEDRLKTLRRARDLILAGHAKKGGGKRRRRA